MNPAARHTVLLLLPLLGAAACSSEPKKAPGQLVLSVTTDMTLPTDIDTIGVEVVSGGVTYYSSPLEWPFEVPATLTLVAGKDPSQPVTIRVYSEKDHAAKTFREIVTTVPADRTALLPVSVQWLCWGQAKDVPQDTPESTCSEGLTCVAGTCASPDLSSDGLPDYSAEAVFGGGNDRGEGGDCFDTVACFSSGDIVDVDPGDCSIAEPSGGSGVNVAIVLPPRASGESSHGICGPEACLVPLDAESGEGWRRQGGRIALPLAACERPGSAIAVTTACADKTVGVPACGDWSVVSGNATQSQGAPAGYTPPALGDGGAN